MFESLHSGAKYIIIYVFASNVHTICKDYRWNWQRITGRNEWHLWMSGQRLEQTWSRQTCGKILHCFGKRQIWRVRFLVCLFQRNFRSKKKCMPLFNIWQLIAIGKIPSRIHGQNIEEQGISTIDWRSQDFEPNQKRTNGIREIQVIVNERTIQLYDLRLIWT